MKVFVSCQQTPRFFEELVIRLPQNRPSEIKLSSPPFNVRDSPLVNMKVEHIDTAVYGIKIQQMVSTFLRGYEEHLKDVGVKVEWKLDTFVQKKTNKMREILKHVSEEEGQKLKRFIDSFEALEEKSIRSVNDWYSFLAKMEVFDWEDNLHIDEVLGLFDLDSSINKISFENPETKEMVTLGDYSTRWISKAVCAYRIPGCLTDLVNLVVAMTGEKDPFYAFTTFSPQRLWIPDILFVDLEMDDLLVMAVVKKHNKDLQIVAQLPSDEKFDILEKRLGALPIDLFRDKDSKNGGALNTLFNVYK